MNADIEVLDPVVEKIIAAINEGVRLHNLSDLALLREAMQSEISDHPVVVEMMNRINPDYLNEV